MLHWNDMVFDKQIVPIPISVSVTFVWAVICDEDLQNSLAMARGSQEIAIEMGTYFGTQGVNIMVHLA